MDKGLQSFFKKATERYELKELERLGLSPDSEQRNNIILFIALLLKWNKAAGLVSPKDEGHLFLRHFCDSLQPLLLFGFKKNATVLDVGVGGGFPSIPIRIFRPDLTFVLAESNKKKAEFLNEAKQELDFANMKIFNGRAEKLPVSQGGFDYIVCRGVGSLHTFTQIAKPHLAPDGRMYTFKTKQFSQELEQITANKAKDLVRINEIAEYDLGTLITGLKLVSLEQVRA